MQVHMYMFGIHICKYIYVGTYMCISTYKHMSDQDRNCMHQNRIVCIICQVMCIIYRHDIYICHVYISCVYKDQDRNVLEDVR